MVYYMKFSDIMNLALRKGLFFPSAEIYNPLSGFWEYSGAGTRIRNNIVKKWRKFVDEKGFIEIHGSTILPEAVFKASGHLGNFKDPVVQCKKCHTWHRADHLISEKTGKEIAENLKLEEYDKEIEKLGIKCKCGGELSKTKFFNMMMGVKIGATLDTQAYLRPETCQNIFVDFLRIYKSGRKKLPLGIAQVGHSYRNEIAPRNSLLRAREFSQMEIEIFFNPEEDFELGKNRDKKLNLWINGKMEKIGVEESIKQGIISDKLVGYYLAEIQDFYVSCGIEKEKIRLRKLDDREKAFYAKESFDLEVLVEGKWIEMVACNNRSNYDLKQHSKFSGQDFKIEGKIPHVFELSAGLDRLIFVLLGLSYKERDERYVLSLKQELSPYLAGVFPLLKNNKEIVSKAKEVYGILKKEFDVYYDEKASIGRRYSRADEIGVAYGLTIDHQTLEDNSLTIRDRDSTEQKRVNLKNLKEILRKLYYGEIKFSEI